MDKELLRAEYERAYGSNPKRVDYYMKQVDVVIELENGGYIVLDKPRIETTFCFGYGWNGSVSIDDMEEAYDQQKAIHKEENFKAENLKDIDEKIRMLRSLKKRNYADKWWADHPWWLDDTMKGIVVYRSTKESNLYWYSICDDGGIKYVEQTRKTYVPTKKDIEAIISGLEEQRAKFSKRLDTYLKRYGTSKLKTWTYLVD